MASVRQEGRGLLRRQDVSVLVEKNIKVLSLSSGDLDLSPCSITSLPLCVCACTCAHLCTVASSSLPLRGLQSIRLLCPWDSLAKSTGVGCHFLLQVSCRPRDGTRISCVSCIGKWILYHQHHLESPHCFSNIT